MARVERLLDDPVWRHRGNPEYSEHNPLGFRARLQLEETNALLTGSSHVYGTNLQFDQTWPERLREQGLDIYNAAMGAWSFRQFALVAEKYLRPNHRLFVLPVFIGFDTYATLKHTEQCDPKLAGTVLGDNWPVQNPSWKARDERDTFIKEVLAAGGTNLSAMEAALAAGFIDSAPYNAGGIDWWLEPTLRTMAMDPDADYNKASRTLAAYYLKRIASFCALNRTRLIMAILPTREYVVAQHCTNRDPVIKRLIEVEDDLARWLVSISQEMADAIYDFTPVYVSRFEEGIFVSDIHNLVDGHPSAKGSAIIADTIKPYIERFL